MVGTYSCDIDSCDKVFRRDYELRKHKVTHSDPDRVFHCSECDFITLQRKSLHIHFALHTGEKAHRCPHFTECNGEFVQCEYKTNDPAALSKHRKKVHAYVPPPGRSRAGRRPFENKDENTPQRSHSSVSATPPRRSPRSLRTRKDPKQTTVPNPSPLHQEIIDVDAIDTGVDECVYVDFDEDIRLDPHYDPTLSAQWMAMYENSYTFDETRVKYVSMPNRVAPVVPEGDTSRDGCLCPEWMVEAGVEGWY